MAKIQNILFRIRENNSKILLKDIKALNYFKSLKYFPLFLNKIFENIFLKLFYIHCTLHIIFTLSTLLSVYLYRIFICILYILV